MPPPDGALDSPVDEAVEPDAAVGAGLDALDTPATAETRGWPSRLRGLAGRVLPLILALVVLVAIWQALWAAAIWPEFQLPAPKGVWQQIASRIGTGEIFGFLWVSVHRAVIGFLI